jgi:MFS family permease
MTTTTGATGLDEDPAGLPETGRRRWAVLAVVSAAQFLTVLDLWVVNIALPALQHDFAPATLSDVAWILDVYAIVLATLLLPSWPGWWYSGSRRWGARWRRGCPR